MKIAVAGTGYVGLSISCLIAQHHTVCAVDLIKSKVDSINNRKSPIQDEYIEKYLAEKDLDEAMLAAYDSTISHLMDQKAYIYDLTFIGRNDLILKHEKAHEKK